MTTWIVYGNTASSMSDKSVSRWEICVFGLAFNSMFSSSSQVRIHCENSMIFLSNFTGKELDAETGYSYFGARYYAPATLTAWLSVDPMSDKYPSISPYAYCAWNPLKLVDPDGKD